MTDTFERERVLDALEGSTRSTIQMLGQINEICQRQDALKSALEQQMRDIETEMGTTNAHLDNLVREAQVTNQLLRSDQEWQTQEENRKAKIEDDERKWKHDLEERNLTNTVQTENDKRAMLKKAASELWSVGKQPLAWFVAAFIGFLVLKYLNTNQPTTPTSTPTGITITVPKIGG